MGNGHFAKWKLNLIMFSFVILTSTRYISTKLIDEAYVLNEDGERVDFRHPVLQSILGYVGEFIIVLVLLCFYKRYDP